MFSGLSKYLVEKGAGSAVGEEWGERKVGGWGQHSQVVEEAERNSKQHVDNSEDDGHLHLEGVQEGQLVAGNVPDLCKKQKQITSNLVGFFF